MHIDCIPSPSLEDTAWILLRALLASLLLNVASTEAARPSNNVEGTHQTIQAVAVTVSNDMFKATWIAKHTTPRTVIALESEDFEFVLRVRGVDDKGVADVDIASPAQSTILG